MLAGLALAAPPAGAVGGKPKTPPPPGFASIGTARATYANYGLQVGMGRDARAVVSWAGGRVRVARSLPTTGQPSRLQQIQPFSGPYWKTFLRMAVGPAGDAAFVGGRNSLRTHVRTRSFEGGLGMPLALTWAGARYGSSAQAAAVAADGSALVVKSRSQCCSADSAVGVIAYRVAPDGAVLATLPLHQRIEAFPDEDGWGAEVYDVQMDRAGNAVVLWETNNGSAGEKSVMFVQRVSAAGAVGAPIEIARGSRTPRLAVAPDGWTAVGWAVGRRGVDARLVSPAGAPGPRWKLTRSGGGSFGNEVSVAAFAGGAGVASWVEGRSRRARVASSVLRPRGPSPRRVVSGAQRRVYADMRTAVAGRSRALLVWGEIWRSRRHKWDIRQAVLGRVVGIDGQLGPLLRLAPSARDGCRDAQAAGNGSGSAIVACAKPAYPTGGPAQVLVRRLTIR